MQLIKSIPSKTIVGHGFEFQVYEPVAFRGDRVRANIRTNKFNRRVYPEKLALLSDKEKYHALKKLVDLANVFVEQHYVGDDIRLACEDTRVSVFIRNQKYLTITVCYSDIASGKVRVKHTQVGSADTLTKEKFLDLVKRAGEIRLIKNTKFNQHHLARRKQLRDRIEREILEREQLAKVT